MGGRGGCRDWGLAGTPASPGEQEAPGPHSLGELSADPGGRVEHLADAAALGAAGHQVGAVKQHGHLRHGKPADGLHADGHIQHLGGDEVAVAGALQSGQLHQDADVPAGQSP